MKSAFSALLLMFALIGMSGCLPVSTHPLSAPEDALADTRLTGVWIGKSGEDTIYLHFVQDKDAMTDIVEVDHQQGTGAHTNIYTMFPTVIDGQRYMNIREKKSENKSYYLARYTVSKSGALSIWFMSEQAVVKAIKAESIAGKVSVKNAGETTESRDITLTASTASLAAYVHKSDPEVLFGEKFGTFKKLTLPSLDEPAAAETPAKPKTSKPSPTPKKPASTTKKKKPAAK